MLQKNRNFLGNLIGCASFLIGGMLILNGGIFLSFSNFILGYIIYLTSSVLVYAFNTVIMLSSQKSNRKVDRIFLFLNWFSGLLLIVGSFTFFFFYLTINVFIFVPNLLTLPSIQGIFQIFQSSIIYKRQNQSETDGKIQFDSERKRLGWIVVTLSIMGTSIFLFLITDDTNLGLVSILTSFACIIPLLHSLHNYPFSKGSMNKKSILIGQIGSLILFFLIMALSYFDFNLSFKLLIIFGFLTITSFFVFSVISKNL